MLNADDTAVLEDLLGANLFAYCMNNPVIYSDPSGYFRIRKDINCNDSWSCYLCCTSTYGYSAKSPGKGWEWRGKGKQGSSQGNYTNPKTGESLHPDLGHSTEGKGIGPHWDYKSPDGEWYRVFPDGTIQPK